MMSSRKWPIRNSMGLTNLKKKNELKLLSNDVIAKMAYQKLTDKGIVTSHNSPVNLPVKGQARGKTMDTIETSSEKITLKLQRKNN